MANMWRSASPQIEEAGPHAPAACPSLEDSDAARGVGQLLYEAGLKLLETSPNTAFLSNSDVRDGADWLCVPWVNL